MKPTLLTILGTLLLFPLPPLTAAETKPNIVFILADDLGYGDLQCYNPSSGKIPTPNLDRLATEGVRFTDAHSASSVCTPTRYSVLTGRYAWRTHLQSGVLGGFSPALIAPDRMTVASLLKANGYQTACIGKWHLGMTWPTRDHSIFDGQIQDQKQHGQQLSQVDWNQPIRNGPITVGFDYFFGIAASLDMPPFVFIENDRVIAIPTTEKKWLRSGPAAADFEAEEVMPVLTRKAAGWIEQRATERKPFFLYLAYSAPHTPILPTKEWQGKSGLNAYADFVMQTDAAVGELLAVLERLGLATNTLVIFTSDNGCSPAAGIGELKAKGHNSSGPWRGHKADIWEGGHRVPFIARWPGRVKAGTTSDETICLGDLLATSAALVGAKLPANAGQDSVNILPALLGEKRQRPLREATVHHSINGLFAIRQGKWKLCFCPGSGGWSYPKPGKDCEGLPPLQLFDLAADPAEKTNLASVHPEIVQQLGRRMRSYIELGRSTPGLSQTNTPSSNWPQTAWMKDFPK